jgi:hypothetical protein
MSDDSHKSGLARFFSKFDFLGKALGIDDRAVQAADWSNEKLHKVIKKDPFVRFDRQHGAGSWGGVTGKTSDWAYDHPADALAVVGGAIAGGAAASAAGGGGGGGAAAAGGGTAAGTGAAAGGIGAAIDAAIPTVTVTGTAGAGAGTAAAVGAGAAGAGAAASNASTSSNGSNGNSWQDWAKKIGGQLQQSGKDQEEQMLEALARQGPPPTAMTGGGNLSPVPIDQYQQTLTPQKVFGA